MRSNGDWVTPLRISPQTCTELFSLFGGLTILIYPESTGIPQNHHFGTVVSRITPDICISVWTVRVEIYLAPLNTELNYATIVLLLCYFYRALAARAMASGRSSDMDQAGPSYAPSDPLPGTFFGLSLDITSEKLYDLAPDIPDVMVLRAVRPSAAVVKVMSVPDSRCIRVVTPDDHMNIGFHEILLHDMGEEEMPFVATSELDYLRRIWPRALFAFMNQILRWCAGSITSLLGN